MPETDLIEQTGEKDYYTADKWFAAYLMTKFTFLGAIDTRRPVGGNRPGTKKEFNFLVPVTTDMDKELFDFQNGADATKVPAVVMANKIRLINDHIQRPIKIEQVA
jgi:hypothetical protein